MTPTRLFAWLVVLGLLALLPLVIPIDRATPSLPENVDAAIPLVLALIASGIALWAHGRQRHWEFAVMAAGGVLFSIARGIEALAGDIAWPDATHGFLLYGSSACWVAAAIGMLRRKRKEKAAPTLPAQNG
jgi:peptidoglycan/LPS O-acetylase OafA/YrhL